MPFAWGRQGSTAYEIVLDDVLAGSVDHDDLLALVLGVAVTVEIEEPRDAVLRVRDDDCVIAAGAGAVQTTSTEASRPISRRRAAISSR